MVPVYHNAIFPSNNKNILVINIGGISNYTLLSKKKFFSSDIGPGNVLIDSLCKRFFKKNFDNKGQLAKIGEVNLNLIKKLERKNVFKKKTSYFF